MGYMDQYIYRIIRKLHGLITPEYIRVDPTLGIDYFIEKEDKQRIHHLARYYWAREVLADIQLESVLDIACGAGFGSFLLAHFLPNTFITGADINHKAIEHAQRNFELPNLNYICADMASWQMTKNGISNPLGKYDAIVSFDTLEHLKHREIALMRITENLPNNGVFLLSTPCGHDSTILRPRWEHHQLEYGSGDLQNLLKRFFKNVYIPEDNSLPNLKFWNEIVNKDRIRYLNISNPVYCTDPIVFDKL